MNVSPIKTCNITSKPMFGQGCDEQKSSYSLKEKSILGASAVVGVAAGCAILAKQAGHKLKPSQILEYMKKVDFEAKPVITIGAGSCLGGLAGGCCIDKDYNNRKAKTREAVMQIGNISIPILTVKYLAEWTEKYGKAIKSVSAVGAVFLGVFLANILMNKLGNFLFGNKQEERGVKATDFSAHLDDFVLAATYISKVDIVHKIGRLVPFALLIPGYEIAKKEACVNNK